MIQQPSVTWLSSSQNQFVPEIVSPLPFSSGLVRHTLLYIYFFKELISVIASLDKCHTSVFNALILRKTILEKIMFKPGLLTGYAPAGFIPAYQQTDLHHHHGRIQRGGGRGNRGSGPPPPLEFWQKCAYRIREMVLV